MASNNQDSDQIPGKSVAECMGAFLAIFGLSLPGQITYFVSGTGLAIWLIAQGM